LRSIRGSRSPGLAAAHVIGEFRCELDQMIALLEAAMTEGEQAHALESAERQRAMNIARALHDIMAADSCRLGEVEAVLTALPLAAVAAGDGLQAP
jgi:hypothetical protein